MVVGPRLCCLRNYYVIGMDVAARFIAPGVGQYPPSFLKVHYRGTTPCGQYISIKSKKHLLLGCGERITNLDDHKVFKAFMSLERLRWWHSPFLGLVLVVHLFDLPSIHA